jgi:hypothetical protein
MIVTFASLGHMGRLANGLYQIAGTIGIARRNNAQFAFPLWANHDHRDRFGSSEPINVQDYFVNPLPLYSGPELPERWIDWGYRDVVLSESVSLKGHLQSEKYFSHALDEVKWYLRMKDEPPLNDYCAIHVRLGDYDNEYHPRLDMRYYAPAMEQFDGARFLVFSDDLVSAREMFGDGVEYAQGNYIDDFRRLKTCRHFIIGNSSYSAMAAILGEASDKKVIAPRPWFGPKRAGGITGDDIYGSDWKVIDYERPFN